ncbi:MAG: hypothetical protein HOV79_34555 [Hamadaea sp.]|nr:hypothetical protein [Hamadaea sp.]
MNTDSRFLRLALKLDAVASGGLGAGTLLLSSQLDQVLGTPVALTVGTGAFLVVFAAGLWVLASRARISPAAVWFVIVGNLGWVAASVAVAVSDAFALTGLGVAFVLAQAAAVVVFADLEYLGLRKARPQTV